MAALLRWRCALLSSLLAAAVLTAYGNAPSAPFQFDDRVSILENPSIRRLDRWRLLDPPSRCLSVVGRPVVNLTLALNYWWGGPSVRGYHWVNIGIHIAAGLLLYGIARRLLESAQARASLRRHAPILAFLIAALWLLHPLQTESVTYIVQRAESLAALLYLVTIYSFVRGVWATGRAQSRWFAIAILGSFLAMASKETAVSLPLAVLFLDCLLFRQSAPEALQRRPRFYGALAASWLLLAALVLESWSRGGSAGFGLGMSAWDYARCQPCFILRYLALTFWPDPLVFDYGTICEAAPAVLLRSILILGVLALAAAFAAIRWPWVAWLLFLFAAILIPTSSFFPLPGQIAAEHRMYLPLAAVIVSGVIGIWLVFESLSPDVWHHSRAVTAFWLAGIVLAAAAGVETHRRNIDYLSQYALWRDTVAKRPQNYRAYGELARLCLAKGKLDEAKSWGQLAVSRIPQLAEPRLILAGVLKAAGDRTGALALCTEAIQTEPRYFPAHVERSLVLESLGRYEEALSDLKEALALAPRNAEVLNSLGVFLLGRKRLAEALDYFNHSIELESQNEVALFNRGQLYASTGENSRARLDLEAALDLDPDQPRILALLADTMLRLGDREKCLTLYDRAVLADPGNPSWYLRRAACEEKLGRHQAALADRHKADQLRAAAPASVRQPPK
jgi:tetratricopeptide (TPR) repeat protein